jgi:hypothetical protein
MKVPFLNRAKQRQQLGGSKNNPVAGQALLALNLLEKHLLVYVKKNKSKTKAIPLDVVHLYTGIIVRNQKASVDMLTANREIMHHTVICKETETMLGVFGGSCIKYCEDYGTVNIPVPVAINFFKQVRGRISD